MVANQIAASVESLTAWNKYRRMHVILTERLNHELSDGAGLSQSDLEVLAALMNNPNDSVRDIALRCGLDWEKSRLSHQLRRMEARGLVSRGPCMEDNRSSTVSLTEAGRTAAELGRNIESIVIARFIEGALSLNDVIQLGVISDAILGKLSEK